MTLLVELLSGATVVLLLVTIQLFCRVKRMEKEFGRSTENIVLAMRDVRESSEKLIEETRRVIKTSMKLNDYYREELKK